MSQNDVDGDYVSVNRRNWESRVPHHVIGYELDQFRNDPTRLSDVVTFDKRRLGDIADLDVVHLQCHLGTDTLSLARLGARVTGLDFSPSALSVARDLANECGASIEYVESDVYAAAEVLGTSRFDIVYTGIGALCWLPDIERWATVVASLLRPGGRLFLREFHPVLWSLSEPREDGLLVIAYPYFEIEGGTRFTESKSYVDHEGDLTSPTSVQWNHGLGEIVTALLNEGLRVVAFEEHQSTPSNPLGNAMSERGDGEFVLTHSSERLALTYTLQARRPV